MYNDNGMCWELCNGGCHWCDVTWMWGDYCSGCKERIAKKKEEDEKKAVSIDILIDKLLDTDKLLGTRTRSWRNIDSDYWRGNSIYWSD